MPKKWSTSHIIQTLPRVLAILLFFPFFAAAEQQIVLPAGYGTDLCIELVDSAGLAEAHILGSGQSWTLSASTVKVRVPTLISGNLVYKELVIAEITAQTLTLVGVSGEWTFGTARYGVNPQAPPFSTAEFSEVFSFRLSLGEATKQADIYPCSIH